MADIITTDGEVLEAGIPATAEQMSLAIGLTKAEIDQQIATARAYPRSITRATKNVLSFVTLDERSAEECNYALPRGGKSITGPSIRLAEIVMSQWGNCRVGARVVHVDRAEKYVEAEGVFHDLETNAATTARVRRRIVDSKGRLYNDDMIIVTGNAACSIAKRNAILGGVPKAVWRQAHDAALAAIKGDVKTLTERRDAIFKAFASFGVKPQQVVAAIGLAGIEDVMIEHMPALSGMASALKSGEETVESMFGAPSSQAAASGEKKGLKDKLNDVAEGGKQEASQGNNSQADTSGGEIVLTKEETTEYQKTGKLPGSSARWAAADKITDANGKVIKSKDGESNGAGSGKEAPREEKIPDEKVRDTPAVAADRGAEAFHRGMSRRAIPGDYREHEELAKAWLAGFDGAKAAEGEGGGE